MVRDDEGMDCTVAESTTASEIEDAPVEESKYSEGVKSKRMQVAEAQADAKGCVVVLPMSHELFIDIDNHDDLVLFDRRWTWAKQFVKKLAKATFAKTPSPSGEPDHFHIRVSAEGEHFDADERILLQAILGSDPTREMISYWRWENNAPNPTLFFEKKTPQGGRT